MSKTAHATDHLHRGGFADTSRPEGALDAFGSRPGIVRLVDVFYDRIAEDAELEPVFGAHVNHGRGQLVSFFMEWLGGDPEYSRAMTGGQQRAHYKVAISRRSAALWLEHFDAAMAECDVPAPLAKSLMKVLGPLARQMVNIDGEHRARFDACGNTNYLRGIWQLAAKGDRAALAERIDDEPTLVQRRGEGGRTLLWEAAKNDRRDIVQWLLDLGADPNAPGVGKETYGKTSPPETLVMVTPHCVAAMRKKRAVADDLLAAGAVVDMFTASMLGDIATIEEVLAAEPGLLDAEDPAEDFYPVTPLYHAVCGKQSGVVEALVDAGAEVERHSVQLLTLAARRNALSLAETLLARGADASDCGELLYRVVDNGAVEWAELLLTHGASASGMGVRGRTLVEFPEVAEKMLAQGAHPSGLVATCNGNNGNRGIHPEYARALLQRGVDPDDSDGAGRTALTTAAKSGFPDYVEILLEHGADPNAPDGNGRTALGRALTAKQWDIAARLVEAGAEVPAAPLNKTGETPLHKAAGAGHVGLTKALLAAGASASAATATGRDAADYARRAGHGDVVDALHAARQ
ncbi:hypothetical protein HN371_29865 [Candidatus Poribacteria bacterium]|jgi:ankyrin repeat protein/truncated hemoglobin YjbI|nr:hypothetical protein [Candidatus Poribacteria bacterium]MBT5531794.1 hypothetical protein [Candidatus Poribacteria bacterium]MBT5715140.1 hypothetical protein [Candidatus Poribacteria bacterium]MBT7098859.1 hypothetical protein [Candidatus Poribacteria bacterium]MBT7807399.1 hypothetical protein [Candidatus Poribacteria bacterium]